MSMKYVDEYRDPELAKRISKEIEKLSAAQPLKLMEVCGGHTHTIYKHGIEDVLPLNIDLVHGPCCPVCVLPMGRIDDALAIEDHRDVPIDERDVHRLPLARRLLRRFAGRDAAVDRAHVVRVGLAAVRVSHLHLVNPAQVHAAVAALGQPCL